MKVVYFNFDVADWIEKSKEYDGNTRRKKYDIHEKFIMWTVESLKKQGKAAKLEPMITEEILLNASKIVSMAPIFDDTNYVGFIVQTLKQKGYHIHLTD
jgi:hypothetical protein